MCGVGVYYSQTKGATDREAVAQKMTQSLIHRGPDDQNYWSNDSGLTLLHTRLSILDLSPQGKQPMSSASHTWTVVFNGEIYNHNEIRKTHLPSHTFRGHSDTETLVELFDKYGPIETIKKCRGMFAIVAYNKISNELFLLRDRIGEKPLYYACENNEIIVASEIKPFFHFKNLTSDIDPNSISLFLKYSHIPQPNSIFKKIKKLPQATCLKINLNDLRMSDPIPYWEIPTSTEKSFSPSNWQQNLHEKLNEVIKIQMRSDVPYGCFLSGGVDSSCIAALMQKQSPKPIKTFSIGFEIDQYNEAPYAKAVANHLGTEHSEWIVSANDALSVIPQIPVIYDEPFADSSQIPTYLLSKMTRSQVTVSLSGDGGDELFFGYNRYFWTTKIWSFIGWIPFRFRMYLSNKLSSVSTKTLASIYMRIVKFLPKNFHVAQPEDKISKLLKLIGLSNQRELYYKTLCSWNKPETALINHSIENQLSINEKRNLPIQSFMMWHDQFHYLPDDIMVKVDRASMANSLETRAPFLDHELIEFVSSLPLHLRANTNPKKILKDVLYQHVPKKLIDRPKMGFAIPLKSWLRNDLKEICSDLLSKSYLDRQNIFNSNQITPLINEFYRDNKDHQDLIWPLLVFQLWYDKWIIKS